MMVQQAVNEYSQQSDKPDLRSEKFHFTHQGPMQKRKGQNSRENMDASNQMERFQPEEVSQKAANILSIHLAQSPQTQELIEILSIIMRKGNLFNQLAIDENGELNQEYIDSIHFPSTFATTLAHKNFPKIHTAGELLEYLVGVKKNECADLNKTERVSKTKWETVFVGPEVLDAIYHQNCAINENQFNMLENAYKTIFNSMSK